MNLIKKLKDKILYLYFDKVVNTESALEKVSEPIEPIKVEVEETPVPEVEKKKPVAKKAGRPKKSVEEKTTVVDKSINNTKKKTTPNKN